MPVSHTIWVFYYSGTSFDKQTSKNTELYHCLKLNNKVKYDQEQDTS